MNESYTNEIGKTKVRSSDSARQSLLRKGWFMVFEKKLRERMPDFLQSVKFKIVGSVEKNKASADSDIDIVIQHNSSDDLVVHRVRHEIFSLLERMKKRGELTYKINIQEVGNPLIFSNVAMRRKTSL